MYMHVYLGKVSAALFSIGNKKELEFVIVIPQRHH